MERLRQVKGVHWFSNPGYLQCRVSSFNLLNSHGSQSACKQCAALVRWQAAGRISSCSSPAGVARWPWLENLFQPFSLFHSRSKSRACGDIPLQSFTYLDTSQQNFPQFSRERYMYIKKQPNMIFLQKQLAREDSIKDRRDPATRAHLALRTLPTQPVNLICFLGERKNLLVTLSEGLKLMQGIFLKGPRNTWIRCQTP